MSQTSLNTQDDLIQPATIVTETEEIGSPPTETNKGVESQDREGGVLFQTAGSEKSQLREPTRSETPGTPHHGERSTQTWLLDQLIRQFGVWESELLRQRVAQQREQRRLDARQEELDRLAAELAEEREKLQPRQVEVQHDAPSETAGEQATSVPVEPTLPSLPTSAVVSVGRVSTPRAVGEPAAPEDSTGLSTARLFGERSAEAVNSTTNDQPTSPSPSPRVEFSEQADHRSPVAEAQPEPEIQESVSGDADDDSSIQDYMKSLLDREKQGHSNQKPSVTPASLSAAKKPRDLPPETGTKDASLRCEPIILPPRPARRPAPKIDLSAHMPALRDVANHSANSALRHYSQRRWSEVMQLLLIGSIVFLVAGGLAFWFSKTLAISILGGGVVVVGVTFLATKIFSGRHARLGQGEHRQVPSLDGESSDD